MCNLHSNTMSHEAMRRLFDVSLDASSLGNFAAQPAIYPKGEAVIVRIGEDGGRRLDLSSWGFLTPNKSKKMGNWLKPRAWNNARDDKLTSVPLWKSAFETSRCLIPGTGYAEATGRNPATYHWFRVAEAEGFAFAGIWKHHKGKIGVEEVEGLFHSMVTTEPNELAATVHNRMPLVLLPEDHDAWLNGSAEEARTLLKPYPDNGLEIFGSGVGVRSEPGLDA